MLWTSKHWHGTLKYTRTQTYKVVECFGFMVTLAALSEKPQEQLPMKKTYVKSDTPLELFQDLLFILYSQQAVSSLILSSYYSTKRIFTLCYTFDDLNSFQTYSCITHVRHRYNLLSVQCFCLEIRCWM